MKKETLCNKIKKNIHKFVKVEDEMVFCKLSFLNTKTMKMESMTFNGKEFKEDK